MANCCYVEKPGSRWELKCQFPNEPVDDFADRSWCRFHLPLESPDKSLKSQKSLWNKTQNESFYNAIKNILSTALSAEKRANLRGVIFPAYADFSKLEFPEVDFDHSQFPAGSDFQYADFGKSASFHFVKFGGRTFFQSVDFCSHVEFNSAEFNDDTFFSQVTFAGMASFESCQFARHVMFDGVVFKHSSIFESAHFRRDADFSNSEFRVPMSLSGVTIDGDISFSHAQFGKPVWGFGGHVYSEEQAQAFRKIKKIMGEIQHVMEQGRFFALEQRAMLFTKPFASLRRPFKTVRSIFDKAISAGYWLISDYGFSSGRPIIAFAIVFMAWCLLVYPWLSGWDYAFQDSARLTFQQILNPFQILITTPDAVDNFVWYRELLGTRSFQLKLASSFQSSLHITIFALFLLAMRRRFKMS